MFADWHEGRSANQLSGLRDESVVDMEYGAQMSKARGFTLVEVVIAMAVIGAALTVVLFFQHRASVVVKSADTSRALATVITKIKSMYALAGSYAGLQSSTVWRWGIAPPPLGSNTSFATITDSWGNNMDIWGGTSSFVIRLGGHNSSWKLIDEEACVAIASSFAQSAKSIWVGIDHTVGSNTNGGIVPLTAPGIGN
jgi:prepilin-type N-terminal cleavage/methylation domain-containing protein